MSKRIGHDNESIIIQLQPAAVAARICLDREAADIAISGQPHSLIRFFAGVAPADQILADGHTATIRSNLTSLRRMRSWSRRPVLD